MLAEGEKHDTLQSLLVVELEFENLFWQLLPPYPPTVRKQVFLFIESIICIH